MSKLSLHDEASLYMDCNGRLWYFKKFADSEHKNEILGKVSLFAHCNLYKIKIHLRGIVTERNKHPV